MTNLTVRLITDAATALQLFSIYHINDISCKIEECLLYTSEILSVWILVIVTLERFLAIKFPHAAKHYMTPMFALSACLILLVVSLDICCYTMQSLM